MARIVLLHGIRVTFTAPPRYAYEPGDPKPWPRQAEAIISPGENGFDVVVDPNQPSAAMVSCEAVRFFLDRPILTSPKGET